MTSNPFFAFSIGMSIMGLFFLLFRKHKHGAFACMLVALLSAFVGTFHDAP